MRYLFEPPTLLCFIIILTRDLNAYLESDNFPTLPSNITVTFTGSFEFRIIQYLVTRTATKASGTSTIKPIIFKTWFIMFLWSKSERYLRNNFNYGVMHETSGLHSVVDTDKIIDWANGGMVVNFFSSLIFLLLLYLGYFWGTPSWARRHMPSYSWWHLREWKHWILRS